MDGSFWHRKWERNEIAFHECEANPLLVTYFNDLSLPEGSRVFLPLCGKTLDIHWLLSHSYRVAGSELSKIAVEQLFSELGVEPNITVIDQVSRYSSNNIDIFVGDIFSLSRSVLGQIDAIYDRAALVALPEPMRDRYAAHLIKITDRARQLLISYDYDQRLLDGPPFSVSQEEVGRQYQESYDQKLLASADIKGGLKGKCAAAENVWLLKKMMREQERLGCMGEAQGDHGARIPSVRWALAGLSLSMLMPSLDTSIANAGLPTLAQAFTASFQAVQWIILAYLLAITTLIVSVGRLGDIVGRRRLLLVGICLFTLASLLCGVAPTLWLLIASRVAQGLGAAIMLALTMAFVGDTVPNGKTGSAMGLLGTMSAIGTTLGPSLGGILIAGFGWRTIFLVNVPLGILNFLLARRYLPVDRRGRRQIRPASTTWARCCLL